MCVCLCMMFKCVCVCVGLLVVSGGTRRINALNYMAANNNNMCVQS